MPAAPTPGPPLLLFFWPSALRNDILLRLVCLFFEPALILCPCAQSAKFNPSPRPCAAAQSQESSSISGEILSPTCTIMLHDGVARSQYNLKIADETKTQPSLAAYMRCSWQSGV
ncbi:hypothetical protein C8R43DRAFT_945725 [Mycena crocata]|nr:hypothetical protein C8R43DRAFT_945725 [Mycena crocata]